MITGWTVRNSTKISGNFFLSPIKSNQNTSWSCPCKINIKFGTEITCQTSVQSSKLVGSTASYIVTAVNNRCC